MRKTISVVMLVGSILFVGCGEESKKSATTENIDETAAIQESYLKAFHGDKTYTMIKSVPEFKKDGIPNPDKEVLYSNEFPPSGDCSVTVKKVSGDLAFVDQECNKKAFGIDEFSMVMKKEGGTWKVPLVK